MFSKSGLSCAFLTTSALLLSASTAHANGVFGPILPYESFNDSPFQPIQGQFSYFHLETYEEANAPANSPGVTTSAGAVAGPGLEIDSVDGGGNNGHSFFSIGGSSGITYTFNAAVLGQLPTDVGIAWTDGELAIHFTAYDQNGVSLGTINDSSGHGFSSGDGNASNYRLFYAENTGGISSIHISNDSGGIEVDHLQYGYINPNAGGSVPEPASLGLLAAASTALLLKRRTR